MQPMGTTGGFTPLDLRNRRREAQRAVRLAVNAANAALDAWQAAVSNGKRAATALTNAALTQLHLPALSLGLLADISGLRPAAQAKLQQQQGAALAELAASTYQLREAAGGLAAASDSLRTLLDAETAAPLLAEAPVFATLPLHLLAGMFGEVAAMHDAELAVKAGVLAGFQQIVGDLREADQPDSTGSGCGGSSGGGTGRTAAAYEEALRRTMQVYLTAWMLSPEVDERRVEADLAAVNADMRGF